MSSTSTRPLTVDDLDALCALEAASQPLPWDRAALLAELTHADAVVEGAFVDGVRVGALVGALVGYVAVRRIAGETWILNLATAPAARRRGVGRVLVDAAAAHAAAAREPLWLEVREGNVGARALYAQCGFVEVGRRPGYYRPVPPSTTAEAAVLMTRAPTPPEVQRATPRS